MGDVHSDEYLYIGNRLIPEQFELVGEHDHTILRRRLHCHRQHNRHLLRGGRRSASVPRRLRVHVEFVFGGRLALEKAVSSHHTPMRCCRRRTCTFARQREALKRDDWEDGIEREGCRVTGEIATKSRKLVGKMNRRRELNGVTKLSRAGE